jgi:opacity protein-like surface antigen
MGSVMKKLLLTGVAFALVTAGPAMAADLAAPVYRGPVAVYSWTGCYIGANIGEASARQNANEATLLAATVLTTPGSVTYSTSVRETRHNEQPGTDHQGERETANHRENVMPTISSFGPGSGPLRCQDTHPEATHTKLTSANESSIQRVADLATNA